MSRATRERPGAAGPMRAEKSPTGVAQSITAWIHHNFLWLLAAAYILSAFTPQLGLWLRHIHFGKVGSVPITSSMLMLAVLLFNAGIGLKTDDLQELFLKPKVVAFGILANICVPILLVIVFRGAMQITHDWVDFQNLLVGLAIIVSMPIAGSSTAWAQNANGNIGLSLGLVLVSTIISPFTSPLVMRLFGSMTSQPYSSVLNAIAAQHANIFMLLAVALPSCLGVAAHFILGEERTKAIGPHLKLINLVLLLLLNYSNASLSLPGLLVHPRWTMLGLVLITSLMLCMAAYAAGWLISKWSGADKADQASLMFALGMNNNGSALTLAAAAIPNFPLVFLPMIFYTLIQQVLAALVDRIFFKTQR